MKKAKKTESADKETKQAKKNEKKKNRIRTTKLMILLAAASLFLILIDWQVIRDDQRKKYAKQELITDTSLSSGEDWFGAPDIDVQLLTVSEWARPGIAMQQIDGIVIHYTANPGATAQENRDYFENLMNTHTTKASSHFIIGLEGEIIQCIPSSEISYASNTRNTDTLSIECCHYDDSGEFTDETYTSLVNLTAWLCRRFSLDSSDVIRHYDVTGKDCPKYFVDHEDAWEQFLSDVDTRIDLLNSEAEEEP